MTIIPAYHSLKMFKGVTYDFRFKYAIDPTSQLPVDLSGFQATWTICDITDDTNIFNCFYANQLYGTSGVFFGGDTLNPTNGLIDLIIVAGDTYCLDWTQANYLLELRSPRGTDYPILRGSINLQVI